MEEWPGKLNAKETDVLIPKLDKGNNNLGFRSQRAVIVEPLLMLYALAEMPLLILRSQYMYTKVASDMGIDLQNLSCKFLLM